MTTGRRTDGSDLVERAVPGLHDHVFRNVVTFLPRGPALDLGAGSGAFSRRMQRAGFDVVAVDRDPLGFVAGTPFVVADFDEPAWGEGLGQSKWPLVVAIEVIEHVEAPVAFLRSIAGLLAPDGRVVMTTPNVDSLPAKVKLALLGRVRLFDHHGDPTHISPIFWDLLVRQYLPRSGLRVVSSSTYPEAGFVAGRASYRLVLGAFARVLRRRARLLGDNHVLVLGASALVDD